MLALWCVLIALFLVPIVMGLPAAWRLHKMTPLQRAVLAATEAFARAQGSFKRLNGTLENLSRDLVAFAEAMKGRS